MNEFHLPSEDESVDSVRKEIKVPPRSTDEPGDTIKRKRPVMKGGKRIKRKRPTDLGKNPKPPEPKNPQGS